MKYLSVCSGIEAATVAWHPLGWTALAFSEIEKFPSALLAERYPDVPNLGDMTKFQEWPDLEPDVLVGGTPCQSFSVAGLRKGLADPRGNLTLTFLAIAARYSPTWVVWENVPGVLSDRTGAFASLLGGLAELGYGWAYRVLDAQYVRVESHPRAVPQRRRRVFVVGHLGDWRRAAAVLFERESLCGHPPPRREAWQRPADGAGCGFEVGGALGPRVSRLTTDECAQGAAIFANSLKAEGFGASEDGTGRGTPLVPVAFDTTQITSAANYSNPKPGDPCHRLAAGAHPPAIVFHPTQDPISSENVCHAIGTGSGEGCATAAVAFQPGNLSRGAGSPPSADVFPTLKSDHGRGLSDQQRHVMSAMQVRRLTPRECERLQGFPDDYTLIQVRGKPAADGPRYRALGNSMAVNVMRWIGERIKEVA